MATDEFPIEYDAIVLGTGMTECIVAAAMSRIGMKVLHMDRNDYYSGDWAVFNFKGMREWIQGHKDGCAQDKKININQDIEIQSLVENGDKIIPLLAESDSISNVQEYFYIKEKIVAEAETDSSKCTEEDKLHNLAKKEDRLMSSDNIDESSKLETNDLKGVDAQNDDSGDSKTQENVANCENSNKDNADNDYVEKEQDDQVSDSVIEKVNESAGDKNVNTDVKETKEEWTLEDMQNKWRYFNLDLAPKVLLSRGALVELLISSDIAKYCEFKLVTRILTQSKGQLISVPCSRADVFSSKDVSVIEKRMMMKFLTFCMEYEKHPDEYKDFEDKPYVDFLKSKRLSENVLHYVLHAIAMATTKTPTLEGLCKTHQFLQSLGRYGNTPFLWPMYGSGEIPQCFCRMCAVFGGIYCLRRTGQAIIVNQEDNCSSIVCNEGVKLKCNWLVMEASFASPELLPENMTKKYVSRAIFITDKSLLPTEQEQITLLSLPPSEKQDYPVTVIEVPPSGAACPKGLYVVHLTCPAVGTAEEDFSDAVSCLFHNLELEENCEDSRPKVLWCVYFNQVDTTGINLNTKTPSNVFITSGPGSSLHFEHCVKQAHEIFDKVCPGEEFCPKAPNPEDIIFEDGQNEPVDPGFQNGSDNDDSGGDNTDSGGDNPQQESEHDSGVEGTVKGREW